MYVELMKNFLVADSRELLAVTLILASLAEKIFDPYSLDKMYVEFMKNFLLGDSGELTAVRLISASWAQKRFDSFFLYMMYVDFMKNFHLADSSVLMAVRLISAPERKNVWFVLSRHDVRRVDEKFSSRRFERADFC